MRELSVVIPTRNRADSLARTLRSLEGQTLPREAFEVIVVDNGSTDATPAVVVAAARTAGNVRGVVEPEPGLHAGRHRGLREAGADVLVYADDDIEAEPGWLAGMRAAFERPEVDLAGGPCRPAFEQTPPAWLQAWWERGVRGGRALGYLSILDLGPGQRPVSPYYVWGCNFGVRRGVIEAAGGFHPDALPSGLALRRGDGETWISDVVAASGRVALYTGAAAVRHHVPAARMTVPFFERRAYNQGLSDSYTVLRARLMPAVPATTRRRARTLAAVYRLKAVLARLPAAGTLGRVRRRLHRASLRGYREHARAAAADDALRAWVTRADYLE